jgi:hypothetical protein
MQFRKRAGTRAYLFEVRLFPILLKLGKIGIFAQAEGDFSPGEGDSWLLNRCSLGDIGFVF